MKAVRSIHLIFILLSLFASEDILAQTVAIGHVSAEVVESVSASSQAITNFNIKNDNTAAQPTEANYHFKHINLGKFKINSGEAVACNIVINQADLSDANGNALTIEPCATSSGQSEAQHTDGNQTLQLQGKAYVKKGQSAGLYQGSYTMVFAYN
jgi:hypothetical protein